jgi:hypothetical protein
MNACLFYFSKAFGVCLNFEDSCFLNDDGLYPLAIVGVVLLADVLSIVNVVLCASLLRDKDTKTEH